MRARELEELLWRLLGGARSRVAHHAAVGPPGHATEEPGETRRAAVAAGICGVKVLATAGGHGVEDAARVRAVREAVGPSALLVPDANCGMKVAHARRHALLAENCDIVWFEEPVLQNDLDALCDETCARMRRREAMAGPYGRPSR